jgi:hypothetical protein
MNGIEIDNKVMSNKVIIYKEMTIEEIPVLYDSAYGGGFNMSKKAIEEYNRQNLLINPNAEIIKYSFEIERHDALLIKIYNELSLEFNNKNSNIKIEYIPQKYKDYYYVSDFNFIESREYIFVDENKYNLDKIRGIIHDEKISNNMKINKIKHFL